MIEPIVSQYQIADGWDDLRLWVQRVVMLPGSTQKIDLENQVETFLDELSNYNTAKKSGRGKQLICSISHSAYPSFITLGRGKIEIPIIQLTENRIGEVIDYPLKLQEALI